MSKQRRIATGIDVGTSHVRVVVIEEVPGKRGADGLRIIGTGLAEAKGLRHGYVVDGKEAAASIAAAKKRAEAAARVPVRAAFVAVGGISLDEARASGSTVISRADQEITALDLEKAAKAAREAAAPGFVNQRVLHSIPLEYRIDGARALGDPVGMKGVRLETDYLFITCLAQHAELLVKAVEDAGVEVVDQMASPLAGSYVLLAGDQKMKGCVLANIGAETTSIVVYDEGIPVSIKVFPVGSSHVTDDIALGFRIALEEAERVKIGRLSGAMYPRKKVDEYVSTRLASLFSTIEKHLKTLGRRGPLPAGIILSGGGAGTSTIVDIARGALKLPARIAELHLSADTKARDATWAVAYGLAFWGLTGDTETPSKPARAAVLKFFRQFLP
jgi:cell division protein FtsA